MLCCVPADKKRERMNYHALRIMRRKRKPRRERKGERFPKARYVLRRAWGGSAAMKAKIRDLGEKTLRKGFKTYSRTVDYIERTVEPSQAWKRAHPFQAMLGLGDRIIRKRVVRYEKLSGWKVVNRFVGVMKARSALQLAGLCPSVRTGERLARAASRWQRAELTFGLRTTKMKAQSRVAKRIARGVLWTYGYSAEEFEEGWEDEDVRAVPASWGGRIKSLNRGVPRVTS